MALTSLTSSFILRRFALQKAAKRAVKCREMQSVFAAFRNVLSVKAFSL